jgi:hypothetical protein
MPEEEDNETDEELEEIIEEPSEDQPLEIIEESFIPDLRGNFQPVNPGLEELDNFSESLERRTVRFIDEEEPEEQPAAGIYDLNKVQNPGSTSMPYDNLGASSSYDLAPDGAGQDAYSAAPQDFGQQPTGFDKTDEERKVEKEREERRFWG